MTTDDGAIRIARRLDRDYASKRSVDAMLEMVVTLGRSGLPIALGMIVDGFLIHGAVIAPQVFASAITKATSRASEAFGSEWDPEILSTVDSIFTKLVDVQKKNERVAREVAAKYMREDDAEETLPKIDDIELGDVGRYFYALSSPPVIELGAVRLFSAGQWIEIGSMTVEAAHIAAWWPMDEETGAEVNYVSNQPDLSTS
jgi:hypothetical protein